MTTMSRGLGAGAVPAPRPASSSTRGRILGASSSGGSGYWSLPPLPKCHEPRDGYDRSREQERNAVPEPVEGEGRSDRADDAHDPAERLLRAHDQPELVLGGALTHERRGRGKQQGGPHRHQNEKYDKERHPGSARRQRRRQRHQRQPEPEQHGADLHRAHFAEAIVEPPDEPDAHQDTHDPEDGEE